jgi:hypothetical protein
MYQVRMTRIIEMTAERIRISRFSRMKISNLLKKNK